ncbi:MAG: transporter ATP-binding protein [Firmicutes bacterium]|nr:transporter ATP-binding protein [Bacillota bacterium]
MLLKLEAVHVCYGAVRALNGVTLAVDQGEIVTILGANGAGKSTLLRLLSGLVPATAGKVFFDGKAVTNWDSHTAVRQGLVQVPEGRQLFPDLTVEENLIIGSFSRKDRQQVRADIDEVCRRFPQLRVRLHQHAATLSGGEQQMVAIARALMARPRLLMLDEPSMGLAPKLVSEVFQIIKDLNEAGTTILLVEQNANKALTVAHRAYVLENGAVMMSGPAAELRGKDTLRRSYLGA